MKEEIHILIVEDDQDINRLFATVLQKHGYKVTSAYSGTEAKLRLSMEEYDLLLLDLMLPGVDGREIVQEVRKKSYVPIIIVSAVTNMEDKLDLLSMGADDYIVKPFETKEVIARVEAQLRRYCQFTIKKEDNDILQYKNIQLDKEARVAKVLGKEAVLTNYEFELLMLFMSNINRVFTREAIYTSIWSDSYAIEDNTVNVHISNLRNKLNRIDPGTEYIKTVWGIGFKMPEV